MKKPAKILSLFTVLSVFVVACSTDDIRNIAGGTDPDPIGGIPGEVTEVNPIDINSDGFDIMEKMQGEFVGTNLVINQDYPYFAWDYRAIAPSHTVGFFEGGSMGNLVNSFFVTNYKGKRTVMIRNGGVLNGIYRTSYFVMDRAETRDDSRYFRFVDAIGGDGIMYMEYRFPNNTDSLYFNAYTSGLGNRVPNRHMTFKGERNIVDLAEAAASAVGYPQNEVAAPGLDFANGFNANNLFVRDGLTEANSATFVALQEENNVFELAPLSGDPYTILEHPILGGIQINIDRGDIPAEVPLQLFLSTEPLTDEFGFFTTDSDAYNTVVHFPNLSEGENEFIMTYMHPSTYYITVLADMDGDSSFSVGDFTHSPRLVTLEPLGTEEITIDNINVQN